jgi:hypothetical protein
MEVSGQIHATAALSPRERIPVPTGEEPGGPQSRSGRGGEEKKSQPLLGIEPRSSSP